MMKSLEYVACCSIYASLVLFIKKLCMFRKDQCMGTKNILYHMKHCNAPLHCLRSTSDSSSSGVSGCTLKSNSTPNSFVRCMGKRVSEQAKTIIREKLLL